MTEYETAALALQEAALGLQELSVWATVGVGLLHAALIGCGLWMILRASSDRNRAMDEDRRTADQRHDEAQQRLEEAREAEQRRHEEAMAALRALIERTAPSSPAPAE